MKMNKKHWFFTILLLIAVILFTYRSLSRVFFQQDEWLGFGQIIYRSSPGTASIWQMIFPVAKKFSHFNPLTTLIYWREYVLFGLNFPFYAIISIILHFFNSLLVFYLAWLLLKKKELALAAGLFFSLNSFSHQAVTWVASSLNTQACCLFVLLSLIFLLKKHFLFSILAFAISLGFKEASVFLFFFLPLFWLMEDRKRERAFWLPFLLFSAFYFGFRVWLFFSGQSQAPRETDLSQPSLGVYLYRLVALPLRVIPQSMISAGQIINWAQKFVFLVYPQYFVAENGVANPYVVETLVFDLISFFLVILIFLAFYLLFRYLEKTGLKELSKDLLLAGIFILMSVLPFIFIPGNAGYSPVFEPRNLYITGIGSSLLLTILIFGLSHWVTQKIPLKGRR